jgi:hypothetical protein
MADVEVDGVEKTIAQTERFIDNVTGGNMADHIDDEIETFRSYIRQSIQAHGLVESGDLLNSFKIERAGNSWNIFSTEAHADYLEYGTGPHTIRPDEADVLAFEPENPADYGDNYDEETGYVYASVVEHPGNAQYRFVDNAQNVWLADLEIGLHTAVRKEIIKSGLSKSIQTV